MKISAAFQGVSNHFFPHMRIRSPIPATNEWPNGYYSYHYTYFEVGIYRFKSESQL